MIRIHCRTNLDILPAEKFPKELPEVPRVGDLIESDMKWQIEGKGMKYSIELEVVRVTWKAHCHIRYNSSTDHDEYDWSPEIELHLPKGRYQNLVAFFEWYGTITGKGKSAFI